MPPSPKLASRKRRESTLGGRRGAPDQVSLFLVVCATLPPNPPPPISRPPALAAPTELAALAKRSATQVYACAHLAAATLANPPLPSRKAVAAALPRAFGDARRPASSVSADDMSEFHSIAARPCIVLPPAPRCTRTPASCFPMFAAFRRHTYPRHNTSRFRYPYSPPVSRCVLLQAPALCLFLARRFQPHARNAARRSPFHLHCTHGHAHAHAVRYCCHGPMTGSPLTLVGLAVAPAVVKSPNQRILHGACSRRRWWTLLAPTFDFDAQTRSAAVVEAQAAPVTATANSRLAFHCGWDVAREQRLCAPPTPEPSGSTLYTSDLLDIALIPTADGLVITRIALSRLSCKVPATRLSSPAFATLGERRAVVFGDWLVERLANRYTWRHLRLTANRRDRRAPAACSYTPRISSRFLRRPLPLNPCLTTTRFHDLRTAAVDVSAKISPLGPVSHKRSSHTVYKLAATKSPPSTSSAECRLREKTVTRALSVREHASVPPRPTARRIPLAIRAFPATRALTLPGARYLSPARPFPASHLRLVACDFPRAEVEIRCLTRGRSTGSTSRCVSRAVRLDVHKPQVFEMEHPLGTVKAAIEETITAAIGLKCETFAG
ncbi:hypothetical protein GGX14DRAFT_669157 [Mycena pura]|uniref:Uncharacterized protein n=1 Tax=Mycena pura TaxID=153505 RepID=A0AAD6VS37_9AGAR|nr:hypothetical protein GGX14DRAFT_669157 [Mycena pura]